MPIKARIFLVLLSLLSAGYMLVHAGTVVAQGNPHGGPPGQEECKPGWGIGDPNHEHCGPPGNSAHTPPPLQ